jgi:hypothetical protein
MVSRVVVQPNGLLARFSEVVDNFTHYNMTKDEAVALYQNEYHLRPSDAESKVQRAFDDPGRWISSLDDIRCIHGNAVADKIAAGNFE